MEFNMSNLRNIGYKIFLLAKNSENGQENLCKTLNFDQIDYNTLVAGRLSIIPSQLKKVAELFSVTPNEIIKYNNNDAYAEKVHCISNFKHEENCDEILDIIDTYIDFAESYKRI